MLCVICANREADPDYGQCCPLCPSRLSRRLQEIPGLVAELYALGYVQRDHRGLHGFPAHDANGRRLEHFDQVANALPSGPINGVRSAPRVSGTSAALVPIRVDCTDLLAPSRQWVWPLYARGLLGLDEDQVGTLSVATVLERAVIDWRTYPPLDREGMPEPRVPVLAGWLVDRLDWAVREHPAVDEFAGEVQELWASLMAANGHFAAPPKSMTAACPSCGGLYLIQHYPGDWIECGECRRLLSEDEYAEYVRGLIEEAKENAA